MTAGLHPLLGQRFSPLSFDPEHTVTADEVDLLVEAARWAPSAGNSQPWAFVPVRRGEPRWRTVAGHLAPSARRWALSAAVLVVNIAHVTVEDSELEFSEFSRYDLGQAVAHMTLQAQAMGLACRQFRAFDLESLTVDLGLRAGWQIMTLTAIGRPVGAGPAGRVRRTLDELRTDPLS